MIEKIKNITKIGLVCVVLLSFIGGSIAMVEQTKFELKNNTAITQNKTLNQSINAVQPTGRMINPFTGNPVNITKLENVTIVKSGTIQLPNNTYGMARYKAFKKARSNLIRELNISHDERLRTECKSNGECTYQIIKNQNTPSVPAIYDAWDEDAKYTESGGTTSFSGEWTVPPAPINTTNTTTQTIFYFLGIQNDLINITILQPVLQWGQGGRKEWEIESYYANATSIIDNSSYVAVAVGDTLNAGITQDSYNPGWWDIDIIDLTQYVQVGLAVYDTSTYPDNFVTLETYDINTCDQFPGSANFYNLNVDNLPLIWWTPELRKTGCGLDVTRVSSSEVILNTKPLADWSHSKIETITGTTAGAQTNYQMKLTLYNSIGTDTPGNVYLGGNARSDFGDIRFTKSDGVTLLDYWIESYTPGVSAVVWVEVDSIPASSGTANIYLYYGNPSATSASNGAATFVFFDDFEDGDYTNNPTWSVEAGAFSVQNENLDSKTSKRLYSSSQGSRINSPSTLAQNAAWEWDYYNQGRDGFGNALQQGLNYFSYVDNNNWAGAGAYYSYRFLVVVGGSAVINYDAGSNTIATGILHYKVTRSGNTWTFYVNDIQKYQGTASGLTSSDLTKYSVSASGGNSASYPNRIDNLRYRNYISPEPTWG